MTASAARIAQGDYAIDVPSAAPDEFGILSRALASLASELKAKIGDLTAERDRLSAILAGMAEGVVVIDGDGIVRVANPAAERILGARRTSRTSCARRSPPCRVTRRLSSGPGATARLCPSARTWTKPRPSSFSK
jgi:signal transduction histidine kinase